VASPFVWFDAMPDAAGQDSAGWQVVPLYHVFGSDEQSSVSGPLTERIPAPYVALHPADIARLGQPESVAFDWHGSPEVLPVRADETLAHGSVGVPVGLRGMPSGPCPRHLDLQAADSPPVGAHP
jgi:NADH-quinone oxidoreductase subunit G